MRVGKNGKLLLNANTPYLHFERIIEAREYLNTSKDIICYI